MAVLTEYEKERLERIAKNQALLASLNLEAPKPTSRDGTPEIKPKAKRPAKPRAPRRTLKADNEVPLRSTRSSLARTVALETKDPAAAKRKREEEEKAEQEAREEIKRVKHADREIEIWNPTGRWLIPEAVVPLKRSLEAIAAARPWKRRLPKTLDPHSPSKSPAKGSTSRTPTPRKRKVKKEEDDDVPHANGYAEDTDERESISMKRLQETMGALSMKAMKRITPDRVYSLAVHPTTDKDLVFIGDRKGWLGIWDASADAEDLEKVEEGEEDELDRYASVQRVFNDHGTISCLRLDPIKAHTLYTSSYDCTIRSLNFETGTWREEVDIDLFAAKDEGEGESLASGFEITHDGHLIWVSDNRGGVLRADLREAKTKAQRWKLSRNKIGCISVNPADENYFVTAHLDREIRLWDARMVTSLKGKSDPDSAEENACVAFFETGRACSSAYFDPSGRYMAATAYDNTVRIWDRNPAKLTSSVLGDWKPNISVPHDNDTGAYVSVFKATWSSNPDVEPYFTIGNMKRAVDIYGRDGKLIRKLGDDVSTVPAVTCGHPSKPVIFGGAAGGKVYYWRAEAWQ